MAMEKEALTHRIEDDLSRRNRNWDKIDEHLAESATGGNPHGINSELNLRPRIISHGIGSSTLINNLELSPYSLYLLVTGTNSSPMRSLYLIATHSSDGGASAIRESSHITITFSGLNISVVSAYHTPYSLIKLN